jgi:hypothetical protein
LEQTRMDNIARNEKKLLALGILSTWTLLLYVINNDIILMVLNRSLYQYEHRDR